jgi:hypothetical protein
MQPVKDQIGARQYLDYELMSEGERTGVELCGIGQT